MSYDPQLESQSGFKWKRVLLTLLVLFALLMVVDVIAITALGTKSSMVFTSVVNTVGGTKSAGAPGN